jgi:uncharacterized membrane protein
VRSRLISLFRKEIQILRDPRTLALVLVIPIMQLFLLGYAAANDVRNVLLAIFDQNCTRRHAACWMPAALMPGAGDPQISQV